MAQAAEPLAAEVTAAKSWIPWLSTWGSLSQLLGLPHASALHLPAKGRAFTGARWRARKDIRQFSLTKSIPGRQQPPAIWQEPEPKARQQPQHQAMLRARPTELRVPAGMMGSGGKQSYMGTGYLAGLLCSNLGGVKETQFFLLTMERAGGYTRDSTCQRAAAGSLEKALTEKVQATYVPDELEVQLEGHSDQRQVVVLFRKKGPILFPVGKT